jgi:hypothetical protein
MVVGQCPGRRLYIRMKWSGSLMMLQGESKERWAVSMDQPLK